MLKKVRKHIIEVSTVTGFLHLHTEKEMEALLSILYIHVQLNLKNWSTITENYRKRKERNRGEDIASTFSAHESQQSSLNTIRITSIVCCAKYTPNQ